MDVFVIGSRNPSLLVVPPGVFHGWMSLEDDTQMISVASEVYVREKPDEVRVPPDSFGDVWKVKGR
jgi:dTDP-4-dehydrorhamnose 3,5-epimerase